MPAAKRVNVLFEFGKSLGNRCRDVYWDVSNFADRHWDRPRFGYPKGHIREIGNDGRKFLRRRKILDLGTCGWVFDGCIPIPFSCDKLTLAFNQTNENA